MKKQIRHFLSKNAKWVVNIGLGVLGVLIFIFIFDFWIFASKHAIFDNFHDFLLFYLATAGTLIAVLVVFAGVLLIGWLITNYSHIIKQGFVVILKPFNFVRKQLIMALENLDKPAISLLERPDNPK